MREIHVEKVSLSRLVVEVVSFHFRPPLADLSTEVDGGATCSLERPLGQSQWRGATAPTQTTRPRTAPCKRTKCLPLRGIVPSSRVTTRSPHQYGGDNSNNDEIPTWLPPCLLRLRALIIRFCAALASRVSRRNTWEDHPQPQGQPLTLM